MEEVQGGPARGRGRGGRGTRGRGPGRCANRGRGFDGLEDAAAGGERGGAADRGGHGRGRGRGRVSNVDRQRLVDAIEGDNDYHELAALLDIPYQTARSYMSGWRKVVYKDYQKAKLATSNWQMTCKPSLEISCHKSLSSPSPRLIRNWRFASQTRQFQTQPSQQFQNQRITTKIAGKDNDVPYERNRLNTIERRFQYATWSVNLGQHSLLPVCATSSIPSFTVSINVKCTSTSRGLTSLGRAPFGERVRRIVTPSGRNVNITLAISPHMALVHHITEQRTVTRATFQAFINELVVILTLCVPINEEVFIIFDSTQPYLNIVVPLEFEDRFHVVMLPPYQPFFNPIEQAHSCLKSAIKQYLMLPHIQAEILEYCQNI